MSQWENEEEEPEEPLWDPQPEEDHQEEDHQEEEDPQPWEERQHNQLLQQQTSKPWAKTLPSSKEKGAKLTRS